MPLRYETVPREPGSCPCLATILGFEPEGFRHWGGETGRVCTNLAKPWRNTNSRNRFKGFAEVTQGPTRELGLGPCRIDPYKLASCNNTATRVTNQNASLRCYDHRNHTRCPHLNSAARVRFDELLPSCHVACPDKLPYGFAAIIPG
jgi:hypothetical protein